MDTVKNTDLPDLLGHLGYRLQRVGRYYTTREMDSIRIKDRRTWRRYSNNTGGDAITFLQEFEGKGFREAVEYLLDFNGRAIVEAIKRVEDTLIQDGTFSLPGRKAPLKSDMEYEVILVDATESPIERPKKSKNDTIPGRKSGIH